MNKDAANIRFAIGVMASVLAGSAVLVATASGAYGDDLFSKKSVFGDNNSLFDDGEPVKKIENASQATEALKRLEEKSAMANSMAVNDSQLFSQMRAVASWVDNYVVWNHRFPEIGDESTYAFQQLNDLVPNNPYISGSSYVVPGVPSDNTYLQNQGEAIAPAMPGSKADGDRIRFVRDYGLTVPAVDEYSKDPPVDWRAAPGTITIITNDQYLFIVWGAGADGKPLRDLSTKRVRFAVGNYQHWDAPVMDMQID